MASLIEIPEPQLSRIARGVVLGAIAMLALVVWSAAGGPGWAVSLAGAAAAAACVSQQHCFQADREQGFARMAWTVFGRAVLVVRRTRLGRFTEVGISRRERRVERDNGRSSRRSSFPVQLVGDDGFLVFTLDGLDEARALAARLSLALGLPITDLVAEKLEL